MKNRWQQILVGAGLLVVVLALCGCASIYVNTKAYLGSPRYAPTHSTRVQILAAEPRQPNERLGEVMLSVGGSPSKEKLEEKLKRAAARLGADAVYVVYDKTHVFPVVYVDWWGGPYGLSEEMRRDIVAVAVKYR